MKIQHSKQWSIHSLRIVLTALYIVSIVPLLIMAFFSYPVADDFAMAVDVHAVYAATGSFFSTIAEDFVMAWHYYTKWCGYYTSDLLMAMPPSVFGEHAALLAGLSVCTGDCAVTKQADLQEDSTLILDLYNSWKKGNKVVLAIRSARDENPVKKFFAGMYYWMVRKTINKEMPQGGCDCYLLDRQVIQVIEDMGEKNSSLTLQVMWAGFPTEKI